MLNRWLDNAGVMHSLTQDGSPRCGARYHMSGGAVGDYKQERGPKCKRCLKIVEKDA